MYKKNEQLEVTITDIGHGGEGIGKVDGYPIFIKDALIGDVVQAKITKAKKNYAYGRLEKIIQPSTNRVEAKCRFARQCGGCQIQEMSYQEQLRFKETMVKNNLQRIGGLTEIPMEKIIGMEEPFYYRNKAQFPVGVNKEGKLITGFYAGRTHSIINNRDCCLGVPVNGEILDIVMPWAQEVYELQRTEEPFLRHILIRYGFQTKEIMVCLIVRTEDIPQLDPLVEKLRAIPGMTSITLNINKKNTNVILGEKLVSVWGQDYITDYIDHVKFQISPLSFYQVNPVQTEKLYKKALEYADLTGEETVWDLYCGIGTISLFLAQKAKQVYGVEIVPQAIADARNNAKINEIENARFYVGSAEEVAPKLYEQEQAHADVVVVDPPRKGCEESLLNTIVVMKPEKIVYVSCDSATLARDLKYLCGNGYSLKKVCPVDQFGQTVHVETVCALSRE